MIMEHIACEHVEIGNLISAKGGDHACHPMAAWSSIGCCGCTHADSRNLTPVNILPKSPPVMGVFCRTPRTTEQARELFFRRRIVWPTRGCAGYANITETFWVSDCLQLGRA